MKPLIKGFSEDALTSYLVSNAIHTDYIITSFKSQGRLVAVCMQVFMIFSSTVPTIHDRSSGFLLTRSFGFLLFQIMPHNLLLQLPHTQEPAGGPQTQEPAGGVPGERAPIYKFLNLATRVFGAR
jgi:hypothetical protein